MVARSRCSDFKEDVDGFFAYYMPCIILIGLIGNTLSALTFMFTKLRKIPNSYYLTALAMADSGMLLGNLFLLVDANYSLQTLPVICQLTLYFGGVCSFLSVWYVVCFTVERYVAVRHPLKRIQWCSARRVRHTVVVIALFACVFNSHILISTSPSVDPVDNQTVCSVRERYLDVANTMNHIDSVLTLVIPLVVITMGNASIALAALRSSHSQLVSATSSVRRKRPLTRNLSRSEDGMVAGLLLPILVSETFLGGDQMRLHVRRRLTDDRKMTCTLLAVSLSFLFMNFPDHVVRMLIYGLYKTKAWDDLTPSDQCWITAAQKVTTILFNTNFAINFFVYSLIGANFRKHLGKLMAKVIGFGKRTK